MLRRVKVDREEYGKHVIRLGRGFVFEKLVITLHKSLYRGKSACGTPRSSKPSNMYPAAELMYFYLS
jgi:hypothetical protein